ncbi:MAG: hypothetical protein H7330_12895 [Hymenobacteraceae bacterium]|nr:hypothetical protein [Hymenobacteraceae bacterium]
MRQEKEDQLVTSSRVVDFLAENQAELAVNEAAKEQMAVVQGIYTKVSGAHGVAAKATKLLTKAGKAAKTVVLDLIPALLGPLAMVAEKLEDNDLLASVTLSSRQLRKLRPLAFLGVVKTVLGLSGRTDVKPGLAKRGLNATTLKPLHDALTAYEKAQPAPRKAIDSRTLASATLETLVDGLMDELRRLDQEMKAFKLLNRPLYDGYVQMRKIINSGGGGGAKGEVPPGV